MSAIGTKRTWHRGWLISAFGGKANTRRVGSARLAQEAEASSGRCVTDLVCGRKRPLGETAFLFDVVAKKEGPLRCGLATAPLTNSRPIPGKGDNSAACDITIRSVADLLCVQDHTRPGLRSFLSLMRGTINVCFCPLAWPLRFEICHDSLGLLGWRRKRRLA